MQMRVDRRLAPARRLRTARRRPRRRAVQELLRALAQLGDVVEEGAPTGGTTGCAATTAAAQTLHGASARGAAAVAVVPACSWNREIKGYEVV